MPTITICGQDNTVNVLLFEPAERSGTHQITIDGERVQHMHNVLNTRAGDNIKVGELGGLLGMGTVLELNDTRGTIGIKLDRAPPPKLPLTVILALPRPKMLRRVLRAAAELGVESLHLINSYRVEKSYWQSPVLQPSVCRRYFIEGLTQSGDTRLPELHLHQRFKPFVEDQLPTLGLNKRILLFHPGAHPPCPVELQQATTVVIGPEGGFIPYEVSLLTKNGCDLHTLGPRILRVEHALYTAIARLGANPATLPTS